MTPPALAPAAVAGTGSTSDRSGYRARLRRWRDDDGGNAIVEFVFVAIIMLVPLVYLIAAVATVQRDQLAVSQAARDAGRAFATSDTGAQADARVSAAVRLAFADQGLSQHGATVRFVPVGASCAASPVTPVLAPGAQFTVCVIRRSRLPGVPSLVSGRGVTSVGKYVVHVDDFRSVGS